MHTEEEDDPSDLGFEGPYVMMLVRQMGSGASIVVGNVCDGRGELRQGILLVRRNRAKEVWEGNKSLVSVINLKVVRFILVLAPSSPAMKRMGRICLCSPTVASMRSFFWSRELSTSHTAGTNSLTSGRTCIVPNGRCGSRSRSSTLVTPF